MSTEMTQDNNSVEMNTANTRLELPDSRMSRRASEEYSASRTLQSMKETFAELFAPIRDAVIIISHQNRGLLAILGWALVALIGLRILAALLDAINDLPLIPIVFELVGMAYVGWFVYRYMMKANTRQELAQQIEQIKQDIVGSTSGNTSGNISGSTFGSPSSIDVKKSVVINKSPEELYQFWRNFENLPRFMNHIESVSVLDGKRSHWVAKAPLGTNVEWDAEIIDEAENKTIVWRSLEGSEVDSVGSVAFLSANGSGTEVRVTMEYNPPGGDIGAFAAKLFGENPQQQLDEDLGRFKQLMETGMVATES